MEKKSTRHFNLTSSRYGQKLKNVDDRGLKMSNMNADPHAMDPYVYVCGNCARSSKASAFHINEECLTDRMVALYEKLRVQRKRPLVPGIWEHTDIDAVLGHAAPCPHCQHPVWINVELRRIFRTSRVGPTTYSGPGFPSLKQTLFSASKWRVRSPSESR